MKREDFVMITQEHIDFCKREIKSEINCSNCKDCPFHRSNLKQATDCIMDGYRDRKVTNKIKEVMQDFLECFDVDSFKDKAIEIKYSPIFDDKFAWSVVRQDENIIKRGEFVDNQLDVVSCSYPYYLRGVLGVQGFIKKNNNRIMICSSKEMEEIIAKVKEFNKKYKPAPKIKPYFNDEYYFINSLFKIENAVWKLTDKDKMRLEAHNCFLSKQDALNKLSEIQKLFVAA